MSATIVSESMAMAMTAAAETPTATAKLTATIELEFVECECCGLTEECTVAYIDGVREMYQGKWICGLCAEAVKDEVVRSQRVIGAEEALNRHINFCYEFRSSAPPSNAAVSVHLIAAMRRILRRSLDSPRSSKSMPCSPINVASTIVVDDDVKNAALSRSESCIPTLSLVAAMEAEATDMKI